MDLYFARIIALRLRQLQLQDFPHIRCYVFYIIDKVGKVFVDVNWKLKNVDREFQLSEKSLIPFIHHLKSEVESAIIAVIGCEDGEIAVLSIEAEEVGHCCYVVLD